MATDKLSIQKAIAFSREAAALYLAFSDIEEALSVIGNMEAATVALQKKIDALNTDIEALVGKKAAAEQEVAGILLKANETKEQFLSDARAQVNTILADGDREYGVKKAAHDEELSALTANRDALHAEAETLSATVSELKSSASALNEEIIGLEKKRADIETAIDQIKSKL